ncbi:MAG: hypothetical protein U5R48_14210 [Gammaproteobacteria bacterium]|nr:hypothetical protein [Gammaproteobacteria bacterium]
MIPEFEAELSSWPGFGREIVRAFAAQDEFNLIFAPHARLFDETDADLRAEIEAPPPRPDRILIDLGSPRRQ